MGLDDFGKQTPSQDSVQEGQTYDVTIEDTGDEGDGVAKIDGLVVFVSDTDVGDELTIEINKVSDSVAFAEPAD
jgi:predicted RNA-binding protein with TRAM domain